MSGQTTITICLHSSSVDVPAPVISDPLWAKAGIGLDVDDPVQPAGSAIAVVQPNSSALPGLGKVPDVTLKRGIVDADGGPPDAVQAMVAGGGKPGFGAGLSDLLMEPVSQSADSQPVFQSYALFPHTGASSAGPSDFTVLSEPDANGRLPTYAPEWTDFTTSDPGVALSLIPARVLLLTEPLEALGSSSGLYYVKSVEHVIDQEPTPEQAIRTHEAVHTVQQGRPIVGSDFNEAFDGEAGGFAFPAGDAHVDRRAGEAPVPLVDPDGSGPVQLFMVISQLPGAAHADGPVCEPPDPEDLVCEPPVPTPDLDDLVILDEPLL